MLDLVKYGETGDVESKILKLKSVGCASRKYSILFGGSFETMVEVRSLPQAETILTAKSSSVVMHFLFFFWVPGLSKSSSGYAKPGQRLDFLHTSTIR